jgi:hypothetical protein
MGKKSEADEAAAVPYLGYLDKEMTIMGILSSFSVLLVGGLFSSLASAKLGELPGEIWSSSADLLILCNGLIFAAAFCFYLQRSQLAWFYGQICLSLQDPHLSEHDRTVEAWLKEVDSYSAWFRYDFAFVFLTLGILECIAVIVNYHHPLSYLFLVSFGVVALAMVASFLRVRILLNFDWEDDAWPQFWSKSLREKIKIIWKKPRKKRA